MRGLAGPLMVVAARARRSRAWALPVLALAVVFGFAGALVSESVIVGDQGARSTLRTLHPIDRAVRLVWEGPLTPYAHHIAHGVFARFGVTDPSQVLLLNSVRLSDAIVHPVAISPLRRWLGGNDVDRLGPCRALDCPVLVASPGRVPTTLAAAGVSLRVVGRARLSSVPLGYSPGALGDWPILVTGDVAGLARIGGLSGVYRTYTWVAPLPLASVHSWSLPSLEARLRRAQADISPLSTRLQFESPFFGLDAARGRASTAVNRLLPVDGGMVVALVLFVLLAASALQRDQAAEINRLRLAGGRGSHVAAFLLAEAGWLAAVAIAAGLGLAVVLSVLLAAEAGEPVGAVISHGILSPAAAAGWGGGWGVTVGLLAVSPAVGRWRIADLAALAGIAVLVAGLLFGAGPTSAWIGLLVPLICLSAGLVFFRALGPLLRAGERVARRGSLTVQLALVGLGRARGTAGLAICFLAIGTGIAGFGLSFRATLIRGAADRAADRVPLTALVSAGSSFTTPLQVASLPRWRAISHGLVFPVRRTEANYAITGGTVTVPALGVPAGALPLIAGWRASDAPAPLAFLARRLRPPGPARTPGPTLPPGVRWVQLAVRSPSQNLDVAVELRGPGGAVEEIGLGETGLHRTLMRGRVPAGRWEVEAIELSEATGTAITSGHQNGENPAAATQFSARLTLGPLLARTGAGRLALSQDLGGWRSVGAAVGASGNLHAPETSVVFQSTGWPGVVRPPQPSDSHALPVLVDPATAAAAGPDGRIGLTVDGQPVQVHVVGVVRRFPTTGGSGGFVVADESLLSAALEAQLPGQGRPDELWISTTRPRVLQAALRRAPLARLSSSFRSSLDHGLRSDPVASGVTRTLLATGLASSLLALLGMLLVLAGPLRSPRIQADLETQGVGPSDLRRELWVRFGAACLLGIWPGLAIALLLDRLTVTAVGAYESGSNRPPLITVVPGLELIALGTALTALCLACGWAMSELLLPRHRRPDRGGRGRRRPVDKLAEEAAR